MSEYGLPIAKQTACRVGVHTWIKAGSGDVVFVPGDRYDCGMYSQAETNPVVA